MRMGSRSPTKYVLVPGPVMGPGLRPSTRPTSDVGGAVRGKSGSIQVMGARDAEEAPLDVLVHVELRRRPMVHDLPLAHDVHAVRDAQRERHVLLDEQDAEPLALEADECAADLARSQ